MPTANSLVAVADTGNRLQTLEALRHFLAESLEDTSSARERAALTRQFMLVMSAIEEYAAPKQVHISKADEIAARRAARGTHRDAIARSRSNESAAQ
ncbi:MAG: hypothetical protein EOP24_37495 [Hyphomicrobiales bacterium]|nr:MAG: hypothetical protein EOP24_37495 [Hyphomicrobiales bacterium]